MDDFLKQVGARIKEARQKKGLSQMSLAEKIEISLPYMSEIENGKRNPGLETFARLTEALEVSADQLLMTDNPKVSAMLDEDLSELLKDCSVQEKKAILKVAQTVKEGMRNSN